VSEVVLQQHTEIRRAYYQKMPQMLSTTSIEEEESMNIEEYMARADLKPIGGIKNLGDARIDTGLK